MLTKCPECELQVSDKAAFCPHCGYPMSPDVKPVRPRKKSNKRRRLPNGFGQISEIKGRNLRNPFRAMVTVGKTEEGRPICKSLKPNAYFPTYNDAYAALVEYNRNPYDLSPSITVKELYDKWSTEHYPKRGASYENSMNNAWKYCSEIYDMRAVDVRVRHIKKCMEEGTAVLQTGKKNKPSPATQSRIKVLFNLMFDYALEYEIVDKNYSRNFKMAEETRQKLNTIENAHISFTDEEMEKLWENVDKVPYVDILLIQCYSGWRPSELMDLKIKDVDLDNSFFKGGMKTKAGKDRIVPVHSRIRPLLVKRYEEAEKLESPFIFNYETVNKKKRPFTYKTYRRVFDKICSDLNLNAEHRPHDGRKHFVTQAKKYAVDEYAIKYMIGHTIADITEKVYTDREQKWLKEEIEKIR